MFLQLRFKLNVSLHAVYRHLKRHLKRFVFFVFMQAKDLMVQNLLDWKELSFKTTYMYVLI